MPLTSLSLLEKIRAQDPEGWRLLNEQYAPAVYQWSRMDGLSEEDAQDLVQEVFVRVFKRFGGFTKENDSHTFRGWLRKIARNTAYDFHRRAKRRPPATGGTDNQCGLENLLQNDDNEPTDVRLAELPEICERVRKRCKKDTWLIFRYVMTDGFTMQETAEIFGVTVGYVNLVRFRVVKRLREEYGLIQQQSNQE